MLRIAIEIQKNVGVKYYLPRRPKLTNCVVRRRVVRRESSFHFVARKSLAIVTPFPADLEAWTREVFEGKYEASRDEGRHVHLYAPELFQSTTPQALRWIERLDKLSGKYLCRQDLPFGLRRYEAADIGGGKLNRHMSLHCSDLRRLMYGLDQIAGKAVTVEEVRRHEETAIILRSELPKPERRFFAALGRLTVAEDSYYPRTWVSPTNTPPRSGVASSFLAYVSFREQIDE